MHDLPARQPPGGKGMHDGHPQPAMGIGRLEFLNKGHKPLFRRADRHHVIQIHRLHILRPVIQPPMRGQLDQPRRRLQRGQHTRHHVAVGQRLATGQRIRNAVRSLRADAIQCGLRKVFHVDGLAQAARVARQWEAPPTPRQLGDARQRGVAASTVDQGRTQDRHCGATRACGGQHTRLALAQAARNVTLVRVGRALLGLHAGRAERDGARARNGPCRVPTRERIQRSTAENRIDLVGQRRHVREIALQPCQARPVRLRVARQRRDAPAVAGQACQQRSTDLTRAAKHQCVAHRSGLGRLGWQHRA